MIYAQLILEYLKVIFSAPVIAAVVAFTVLAIFREDIKALLLRFAKIRLPGGTEVSISQAAKLEEDPEKPLPKPPPSDPAALALPSDLDRKQIEEVQQLLDAERARISVGVSVSEPLSRISYAAGTRLVRVIAQPHVNGTL